MVTSFRLINEKYTGEWYPSGYESTSNDFVYYFNRSSFDLSNTLYSNLIYQNVVEIQAGRTFYARIGVKNSSSGETYFESTPQIVNENDTAIFHVTY